MRHLLCVLVLGSMAIAVSGCSSEPAKAPPAAPSPDLGAPGSLDKGAGDSTGSTTK